MPGIHRNGDSRECGASTIVTGQSTVFVDDKLVSVEGDPNSHGAGGLIATGATVFANSLKIIVLGDPSLPDSLCPLLGGLHCAPSASQASFSVFAY